MDIGQLKRGETPNEDAFVVSLWGNALLYTSVWRGPEEEIGPETLISVAPMAAGVWQAMVVNFAPARLGMLDSKWQLRMARSRVTTVRVSKRSNVGAKQIVRLDDELAGGDFAVFVELKSSFLRYSASQDKKLSFEWMGTPAYRLGIFDAPQAYRDFYNRRKRIDIVALTPPQASSLRELWIHGHLEAETVLLQAFRQPSTYRSPMLALPSRAMQGPLAVTYMQALFPASVFPEAAAGKAPADSAWVAQLFAPPGRLVVSGGAREDNGSGWLNSYSTALASELPAAAQSIYRIAPLAQIVRAGAQSEKLQFVGWPMLDATWSVTGEAEGRLERRGEDHYYVPPRQLSPAAVYNTAGETLIPAAYRASMADLPIVAQQVQANDGSASASATFVTFFVAPTHFIRFVINGARLQMKLCYIDRWQEERQVSYAEIKWHVVAGNGTVSDTGVFTPAQRNPSQVTIVMAEDLRDMSEWRFALTIVPMPFFTANEVVRLQED
ncbi:hypothetical protein IV505_18520 [Pseudomonas fulva]|nr:hypothetical protein [Pseudomonas fulva]MBF8781708.1 hypothetical protein [Pseudomonas fulva]